MEYAMTFASCVPLLQEGNVAPDECC